MTMIGEFDIRLLKGEEILPFLGDLAALRIYVFKEYPYLYQGDQEYEKKYLSLYTSCNDFFLVVVLNNNEVIGVTTGLPMKYEGNSFKKAFDNSGYDINDIFYIGETIILPEYRHKGLSRAMFSKMEYEVTRLGYKVLSLATVKRAQDDPKRPNNYIPLDYLWQKYGYKKIPKIKAGLYWCEVGQNLETEHEMEFWLKQA